MGRSDDPFWKEVEDMNDGSMKCKCCGHLFANGTSISRIKWHLSGERGHGVGICGEVPKEVQGAAFLAMRGGNKRHKSIASSSNVNDYAISTCPQEQDNAGRMQAGVQGMEYTGEGSFQHVDRSVSPWRLRVDAYENRGTDLVDQFVDGTWVQLNEIFTYLMQEDEDVERLHDGSETIPRTEQVQHLERGSSCERPSINQADEPRGDSSQPTDPLCHLFAPSVNNDVIMNDVQNMVRVRTEPVEEDMENSGRSVRPDAGARSSISLKYNTSETRGVPLPTSSRKPVGQAFEENKKVIWSLLMDDEVPTIGIYGMGGVGKTTILQHIHNELLQRPDICDHVWWVTVSQDFSINRLQNIIAKRLRLDLSSEDDDLHRAAKLSEELMKKQKWILILDDLWNNFELHEVGIPEKLEGCKLIMTTRSKLVCHKMACHRKIKVKPLFEGEAWTLFMEKLGRGMVLSPEVERIAKAVAKECAGLPLGIITVAGSLRGVDDLHEWRNTLKKLSESEFRDMDEKVFQVLRVSYNRLRDVTLQQCLLYCALFPEDEKIEREELIGYLILEGIIKVKRSRGDAFDEGHTMLNRLEYVCLLENAKREYVDIICVKMHDLIRDMAIQILQDDPQYMVKAGAQLEELPDAEEWTENLTRVSLMQNKIKEIPSSYSPRCPYLSTLECRFEGFSDFVEYLRSRDGILSLSTCKILVGEVRGYVEQCIEDFPSKTVGLGNLSINGDRDFQVIDDIQGLICQCIDARSLCDVLSLENATELERISIRECHNMESLVSSSWFCSAPPRLPSCTFSGLKEFFCFYCGSMKKLFPLVLLPNLVNLERITVDDCEEMEEIIGTADEESSTSNSITEVILPKLITLELSRLPKLKSICSAKLICNSLEDIHVANCEKLKRMPICLPLLENGQPSPPPSLEEIKAYPEDWWERVVEWEHPDAKEVLRPFVEFDDFQD